jgi:hyperosmotically inducible protein
MHSNSRRSSSIPLAAILATVALAGCGKKAETLNAPEGAAMPASSPTANVSDIDVTEHVKTALTQSELLHGMNVAVSTQKGDVSLTGTLDTQAQVSEALRIAWAADGVHAVHDDLRLKP